MNPVCPEPAELLRLLDGEVTENRGAELRAHLAGCPRCAEEWAAQQRLVARLAAPIPGSPAPGSVEAVMRRLDAPVPALPGRRWPRWVAAGAGLAAAAALVLVLFPRGPVVPGAFTPRGGAAASWERKIAVELWAVETPPRRLETGAAVGPGTAYVASYRNLDASPAWLLAFAVDARGETHWLYPAFLYPGSDPGALRLEPGQRQEVLAETVVLEDLPAGPLRVVTLVAREQLRLSSVERLPPAERGLARLRARFPQARVVEQVLTVEPGSIPEEKRGEP